MAPYFLIPIIILLTNLFRVSEKSSFQLCFFLLLAFFAGARGAGVDLDFANYYNLWYRTYSFYELLVEPIPKLIFQLSYILGLSFNFALLVFSTVTMLLLYKACALLNANRWVFLFLYTGYFFYIQTMMQIRFSLALAFFVYGNLLLDRNKLLGCIWLFCSVLSHQSMFLLLIMMPIIRINNLNFTLYLSAIAFLMQFLSIFQYSFVNTFFQVILMFVESEKVLRYYNDFNAYVTTPINVFNSINFLNITLLTWCAWNIKVVPSELRKYGYFFINSMLLGLIFLNLLRELSSFSFRFYEMMFFFLPLLVALVYKYSNFSYKTITVFFSTLYVYVSLYQITYGTSVIAEYKTALFS
ncbi:EpsG family protein [Pseudoalteromonas sp. S2893]|uniref:EpsG family protein n=1 Tax=Pseudoalteromonas sp. S2893 TaxID=579530 RepID=UPI00110BAF27|nr:EpsG family protein [Pseudoalteromonas sp. S2893]TMP13894.1 hypothetical protein CWC04_17965 [Pseudoalteromonas sp. S2893]